MEKESSSAVAGLAEQDGAAPCNAAPKAAVDGPCGARSQPAAQGHKHVFASGMHDGVPIALGYFAVALTLGIAARAAGLTPLQATLTSLLNHASAGEFAGFTVMAGAGSYGEMAVMMAVVNARYLLMSCSLSQKLSPQAPFWQRLLVGFGVTDEIFGISVARPGYLDPRYTFGAMAVAIPTWALGTCTGVILGNVLPARVVSALGVALYGMFLAIIIPPARKNRVVAALVLLSFAASWAAELLPVIGALSSGTRIILLTVVISAAAALLFPVDDEEASDAA